MSAKGSHFLLTRFFGFWFPLFIPCAPPSSGGWSGDFGEDCLSTWPRSGSCEFMRKPDQSSNAGYRVAAANRGRFLFGYFFLATQEKVTDETTSHLTNPANDAG